ncbi:hypothetical protein DMUE_2979 [Dictyocoela muelleri]|nr:hypothetical protein DMUE_2979 [Dictyocoela muelleri]
MVRRHKTRILTQIIDVNVQYQIGPCHTADEVINKVLKLKYNKNSAYKYQSQLSSISQKDYYTIRAYLKSISIAAQKLGICNGWNEEMIRNKIEEAFLNGLDDEVKFDVTRYKDTDFDSICQTLIKMEAFLIEKVNKIQTYDKFGNSQEQQFTHRPNSKTKNHVFQSNYKREHRPEKYCHYHKTRTHSDAQCRAQTQHKTQDNHKDEKSYALRESTIKPRTINMKMKINDEILNAIVDTGSVENYIPDTVIRKMKLITRDL